MLGMTRVRLPLKGRAAEEDGGSVAGIVRSGTGSRDGPMSDDGELMRSESRACKVALCLCAARVVGIFGVVLAGLA